MCIIVSKAKKIKMPDGKTLLRCFENNSDGAGIMWVENGVVNIRKGFMSYKEFDSFICKLGNRLDLTDTALVMHFRITTHGGTNAQTCHPFPISRKIPHLKRISFTTNIGVAHNGIIPIKCHKALSDTQTYIMQNLSYIKKVKPDFYKDKSIMEKIEKDIHSKMCFLTKDEEIYTIGKFIEEDGVLYSNSSYEEYYDFPWFRYMNHYESEVVVCPVYGMIIGNGDIAESNGFEYFIDEDGKVYEYDYICDTLISIKDYQAFTFQETPYRFNEEESIIMNLRNGGRI